MTIPATTRVSPIYTGNASATTFAFGYKTYAKQELQVIVSDGVTPQTLVLDSDYSVALNADQVTSPGGSITYPISGFPLPVGKTLVVVSAVPNSQDTSLPTGGAFNAATVELGLDRQEVQLQQLVDTINRTVRVPVGETIPSPLPAQAVRANMLASFDALGNPIAVAPVAGTSTALAILLASSAGGGNLGDLQTVTGAVPRNQHDINNDVWSIKTFGAIASGSSATNLTAVNAAATTRSRSISVPAGDFTVSAKPTNIFGTDFPGVGAIKMADPLGGFQQLNTYADAGKVAIGHEYLYRIYQRLTTGFGGLNTFVYGDSTVAGTNQSTPFLLQNLLPLLGQVKGLACPVVVTNRGVSGTSITDMNALPDLASTTDLFIIKYGINDGQAVGDRLNTFATNLRSKLAAIRAAAFGSVDLLSIVLVGPNATNDSLNGRDEYWYEQLRQVYVQAARDYKCAYFDTYGYMRDSRGAAGIWMDAPYSDTRAIHPGDSQHAWIWGAVFDFLFGASESAPWKVNAMVNASTTASPTVVPGALPNTYPFGISMYRATIANGWPIDGFVINHRHANSVSQQILISYQGDPRSIMRAGGSNLWAVWSGITVAIPLSNSWVAAAGYSAPLVGIDNDGWATVSGVISGGTITAATLVATLPAGYRPLAKELFAVATSTGASCVVSVDTNGQIVLVTAGVAAGTSLGNIRFKAA